MAVTEDRRQVAALPGLPTAGDVVTVELVPPLTATLAAIPTIAPAAAAPTSLPRFAYTGYAR